VFGERAGRPGHAFNAVNNNGTIEFLDGQSGTWATFDGGYLRFFFVRTG
jgi:hypothetical protein